MLGCIDDTDCTDGFKDIYLSPDSSSCVHCVCAVYHSPLNKVVKRKKKKKELLLLWIIPVVGISGQEKN